MPWKTEARDWATPGLCPFRPAARAGPRHALAEPCGAPGPSGLGQQRPPPPRQPRTKTATRGGATPGGRTWAGWRRQCRARSRSSRCRPSPASRRCSATSPASPAASESCSPAPPPGTCRGTRAGGGGGGGSGGAEEPRDSNPCGSASGRVQCVLRGRPRSESRLTPGKGGGFKLRAGVGSWPRGKCNAPACAGTRTD